ncbi:hypothetical protein BJX99DRAFT_53063 [Aspergillus californicus]
MIPPCDPTILTNNPQFQRLYQHLTTTLLNLDGSTRSIDTQPARKEVRDELKICQMRNAKKQIKKQTLRQLAFDPDNELPDDCREPIAVVTLYLESSPKQLGFFNDSHDSGDVYALLAPDINQFHSKLPILMPTVTQTLSSAVHDLRLLADTTNTNELPNMSAEGPRSLFHTRNRAISARQTPLAPQMSARLQRLHRLQFSELPAARTRMAAKAAEVLAMRAAILERTVTLLERTKHGAMARATKAKAEHLATVAHGVEGKLKVIRLDILAAIHTPEVNAALARYHKHLRDTRERLEEGRALALGELKAYEDVDSYARGRVRGSAKSGPIAEIARQYGALIKDIEDVKMEIQRLHG